VSCYRCTERFQWNCNFVSAFTVLSWVLKVASCGGPHYMSTVLGPRGLSNGYLSRSCDIKNTVYGGVRAV
jgi:hypothetical protein